MGQTDRVGVALCECLDHMIVFGDAHLRRILRGWRGRSLNKEPLSIAPLSASAPSSQDLSLAAFTINIAESNFRHTQQRAHLKKRQL